MKFVKTIFAVLALTLLGATLAPGAHADEWNKKTVMTFSQPVEIPGQVLPAGTYTFVLLDSPADRHIVQIFNADGSQLITTVLAINNYRLRPTGDTVVKFAERSGDNPEALKAWFYPGDNFGQEFVYPKKRAIELAVIVKEPVPALAADSDIKVVPIVAETPEQKEVPVTEAIQVTPPAAEVATPAPVVQATTPAPVVETAPAPVVETKQLPQTASQLPLIALLGLVSLGAALVLKRFSS
ncbi:MAG TPA: LPXTG cell wall anchor domain-containing protein [Candidatus Acidoferrum sp.]|nr:LPXTG cell wall anchor domain-containing protein [Candidatus Acidoferrum sp.]